MSNLGMYQKITKWSKMLGGPWKFLGAVAIGGYIVIRVSEAGVKKVIKISRKAKEEEEIKEFQVHKPGKNKEIEFEVGDVFRVLAVDGEAALIEIEGNDNNPYFVNVALLKDISEFE